MTTDQNRDASGISIGWASGDFTPPGPIVMRGQFYARVSEGVDDPVTVTAMAIESTNAHGSPQQAILITCDLVHIATHTQAAVRDKLKERLPEFNVDMLLMNVTHTHSAPTLDEGVYPSYDPPVVTPTQCAKIFIDKVVETAQLAWNNKTTSSISSAFSHAVVGHNRRAGYFDGSTVMYGQTNDDKFCSLEGYEDHGLNLLFTWDDKNSLTGIIVNLACPSQTSEHSKNITADYWYETKNELRKRFGKDIFILPQCSAAGDLSPHHIYQKDLEEQMRTRKGTTLRDEIAQRIATGVEHVFESAKAAAENKVVFRHDAKIISLPVRMVSDEEYEQAKANCAKLASNDSEAEESIRHNQTKRNKAVIERYQTQNENTHLPIELHVLRLGDVAIATNPFELFLDFAIRMKARSKAKHTFVVQLACGGEGYLPTQKAVDGCGYGAEVASNTVGPQGGQVLVEKSLELIDKQWD